MMDSVIRIERVTIDSPRGFFDQLGQIHKAEIEQGFLSTLGLRFLRNLYRGLSQSPRAFVFAAVRDDQVLGFICGSTDTGKVYRGFFLSRGIIAAVQLLPKMVSWQRVRRLAETLLYPSRSQDLELPKAEILNFCVSRDCQRMGIGKRLFAELVGEFQRRNIYSFRIVTGANQVKAQQFYESLQATKRAEIEVHDGTKSLVYAYEIQGGSQLRSRTAA